MGQGELPSGLVTFVVTDIEASTRLLRQDHQVYAMTLALHHDVLTRSWRQHHGWTVDQIGDGSLAVFADAQDAVLACATAQEALHTTAWPGQPPRVRMGVHTGFTSREGGRYVAIALHEANRIAQAANGGQVLVSPAAAARLEGIELKALGSYRLRDFEGPVALFQLPTPSDREGPVRPPRCLPADHHNLRPPRTSMIDRRHESLLLANLIRDNRLVTVTGSAGVGKSRLVAAWAMEHAQQWPDGVWLADCSNATSVDAVVGCVRSALGLKIGPDQEHDDQADTLLESLRSRDCVVILDDAEHGEAVARWIESALAASPRLQVVVTSTQPMRCEGEHLLRLNPLSVTGHGGDAVELFLDRAVAVAPTLRVDEAYREAARALCERLDGLPLAIELAAARADVVSPSDLLAALHEGRSLPRVSDPGRPARHQALDTLIAWNTAHLSDAERTALQRLSFFPHYFDMPAAVAAAADAGLSTRHVPDLVWSLLDKSLLASDTSLGRTRYRLLNTVRAHVRMASDSADAMAEAKAIGQRLAEHYLALVGPTQSADRVWLETMRQDIVSVRAVLEVLDEHQAAAAQELSCSIARFHSSVQSLRAGVVEISALAARWHQPCPARVGLLTALGDLYARSGDTAKALHTAALADAIRERSGAPSWDEVGVEKLIGECALARDDPQAAIALARTTLRRPLGARGRARLWNLLGICLATCDSLDAAQDAFDQELRAAHECGDDTLLCHAYNNVAEVALLQHHWLRAAAMQKAGMQVALTLGARGVVAYSLISAARIAAGRDAQHCDWGSTVLIATKAEAMLSEIGLTMYGIDRRALENFLLNGRAQLGNAGYHAAVLQGRELDDNNAALTALNLLSDLEVSTS